MANEFKLSFTAQQIDEKLGKIDGLAAQEYVDEALLTKQPIGDYVLKSDIPDISAASAIIDVIELPTESINKSAFYRLMSAKWARYDEILDVGKVYCVNDLPELGQVVTNVDMTTFIGYYNITDNVLYGYVDEMLGSGFNVPAGWYSFDTLAQVAGLGFNGVVTDIEDIPDNGFFGVLLCKDYYVYQDGWCQIPFAYEKAPEVDIQWDGNMDGHIALDMSQLGFAQGLYFVKVSDDVFTTEEMVGWTFKENWNSGSSYETIIEHDMFDVTTYPGAFTVSSYIVVLHDADALATALGIPTGIYTNGVYFWLYTEGGYISRLTSQSKVVKIDEKFLPNMSVDINGLGLHAVAFDGNYNSLNNRPTLHNVATSGNYNQLNNKPTIYSDVVRHGTSQSLSTAAKERARKNIDACSMDEVEEKLSDMNLTSMTMTKIHASNYSIKGIVFGNNVFVSIDEYGGISYSSDGICWSATTVSQSKLKTVCYGADKFIAVGENGTAAYSNNGAHWTGFTIQCSETLESICYGNGMYVAGGKKGCIAYSTDETNWTMASLNLGMTVHSVCYGNGVFVAVSNGDVAAYSVDGIEWTQVTMPDVNSNSWSSVCYAQGKFVAVGYKKAAYSIDGINWQRAESPSDWMFDSVCGNIHQFIAVYYTNYSLKIARSLNGAVWTNIYTSNHDGSGKICYSGRCWVVLGRKYGMYSDYSGDEWYDDIFLQNGTDVTYRAYDALNKIIDNFYVKKEGGEVTELNIVGAPKQDTHAVSKVYADTKLSMKDLKILPSTNTWNSLIYADNKFIASAYGSNSAAYSEDGVNWIEFLMPDVVQKYIFTHGNGMFVAIGYDTYPYSTARTNVAAYSTDGINWTKTTMPSSNMWSSVCYGAGRFVALSGYGTSGYNNIAAYSENGINWTQVELPKQYCQFGCYGNNKFVTINHQGSIVYSYDGISWTFAGETGAGACTSICYGNGKFIATTPKNALIHSEDGINWTIAELPVENSYAKCLFVNGKFFCFDDKNVIAYSEDGISWTKAIMPTNSKLISICYGDDKFVAMFWDGTLRTSSDAINWEFVRGFLEEDRFDVTKKVAESIKPHLNLTASDVGALPAGSIENVPIYLTSPNGSRFQLAVDDNGNLTATAIVETTT